MNVAVAVHDAQPEAPISAAEAGPAPKRTVVAYGFWIFLLSDIVMFSAFFAVVTGFALIWHIWWMAAAGLVGAFVALLVFAFRDQEEVEIPSLQIAQFEARRQAEVAP